MTMQTTFDGLRHPPFSPTPDPRFFYASAAHAAALEAMTAAANEPASPIVLTGPAGSGKTLLCRTMLRMRDHQAHRIYGVCRPNESQRLLDRICKAIKLPEPQESSPEAVVQSIVASWKRARGDSQQPLLIVFDDAHHLDAPQWQEIKLLSEADEEIQVLLSGRPGLAADAKRFVGQSIGPKIAIGPLPKEEAPAYVRHRLHIAGAVEESELFDDMAIEKAHRAARGILALMNTYLDAAMKHAVKHGLDHVDAQTMAHAIAAAAREIAGTSSAASTTARNQANQEVATSGTSRAQAVQAKSNDGAERIAERLEQASDRAERLADRLETISKAVENVLDRVSVQSQRATALEKNLVENVNRSESMNNDLQAQIEKASAAYNREAERVTSAAQAQVAGNVQELDARLDAGRALLFKLEAAEKRIGEFESSVSKQADVAVGDIASHTATLMDRLDEVRGTVMDEAQSVLARVREEGKRVLAEWVSKQGQLPAVTATGNGVQEAGLAALLEDCRACLVDLQNTVAKAEDVDDGVRGITEDIRQLIQDAKEAGHQVQQATTGAEHMVQRLETKAARAESAGEELEGTVTRGVERIDRQQLKLTEQIARAEVVEKELREDADSIRQEQSHFVHERQALETMIRDAATHTAEGHEMLQGLADQIAESRSAERELTERVQGADEAVVRFDSRTDSARELMQDIESAIEQSREIEARMKSANAENQALADQWQSVSRDAQEHVESATRSADAAMQAAAKADEAAQHADRASTATAESIARLAEEKQSYHDLLAQLDAIVIQASEAKSDVERSLEPAAESIAHLADQKQSCHELLAQLESVVVQASEAKRDVERSLEPAAAAIVELETAAERAAERGDAILQAVERHQHVEMGLVENVKKASVVHDALATECDLADNKTKQVASLLQSLESATQRAAEAAQVAGTLEQQADQICSLQREVEEAGALAGAEADRACSAAANLRLMREEVERIEANCQDAMQQSRVVLASADDRFEVLQRAANEAVDKVKNLAEEATTGLERRTTDTFKQIEDVITGLHADMSAASQERLRTAEHLREMQQTVEQSEEVTKKAMKTHDTIADAIMRTDALVRKMADQREAARATLERQQSLRDQDRQLAEELAATVQSAVDGATRLEKTAALSGRMYETLSEQLADAERIGQALSSQAAEIDERRTYLESAQAGMGELMDHVDSITARIRQLQSQSDGLQTRIEQVINKPEQIAADAKAQSEQLEQVARAVQKIFSGLSRSALDAKQKVDQFQEIIQTADTRTRRLTAETSRSVDSLKAWVNEAVHAQSRLAETLNQCPPVSTTHPGSVLQGLSRLADRESGRGLHSFDPPPTSSPLLRPPLELSDPGATRKPAQQPGDGAKPADRTHGPAPRTKAAETMTESPSRAEEIQQLIEDARKFAESGV